MNDQLTSFIRRHIFFTLSVIIVGFALLAIGEYYLYRQELHLNKMISEGFMQVKETQQQPVDLGGEGMMQDTMQK